MLLFLQEIHFNVKTMTDSFQILCHLLQLAVWFVVKRENLNPLSPAKTSPPEYKPSKTYSHNKLPRIYAHEIILKWDTKNDCGIRSSNNKSLFCSLYKSMLCSWKLSCYTILIIIIHGLFIVSSRYGLTGLSFTWWLSTVYPFEHWQTKPIQT